MIIQKIKRRDFRISDGEIQRFLMANQVERLRFNLVYDNGLYISVEYPNHKSVLTFDRSWTKIDWGGNTPSVRTPASLLKHIGKNVMIVKEDVYFKKFEAFRIYPEDFSFNKIKGKHSEKSRIDVPFFQKCGKLIIPRKYIYDNNIKQIFNLKISFDRTDSYVVDNGLILSRISYKEDKASLSYPFYESPLGVRTIRLSRLINLLDSSGKDISNFKYLKIVHDDEYDLIVFQEEING